MNVSLFLNDVSQNDIGRWDALVYIDTRKFSVDIVCADASSAEALVHALKGAAKPRKRKQAASKLRTEFAEGAS